MRKFLTVGIFHLLFLINVHAHIDQYILQCDFLIIGKIQSDSVFTYPFNFQSVTKHTCKIEVTQIFVANWKVVMDTAPPAAGTVLSNVQFNTTDSTFRFPSDSLLFFPVKARKHGYYYLQNVEIDTTTFYDTSLFYEYSLRRNPESHLSFPIITQSKHGKWTRTTELNADSTLVATTDKREKRRTVYVRKRLYAPDGKVTDYCRTKKVHRSVTKTVEWYFRRGGKICFDRNVDRIPLFH